MVKPQHVRALVLFCFQYRPTLFARSEGESTKRGTPPVGTPRPTRHPHATNPPPARDQPGTRTRPTR